MTDQEKWEKVIKALEKLREYVDSEVHPILSPDNWGIYSELRDLIDETEKDALALIKAQEAIKPQKMENDCIRKESIVVSYRCPACFTCLQKHWDTCPVCGQKVKWR